MALEIDAIVRSIENEKISEDERLKCRDAFARIDGLRDKVCFGRTGGPWHFETEPVSFRRSWGLVAIGYSWKRHKYGRRRVIAARFPMLVDRRLHPTAN